MQMNTVAYTASVAKAYLSNASLSTVGSVNEYLLDGGNVNWKCTKAVDNVYQWAEDKPFTLTSSQDGSYGSGWNGAGIYLRLDANASQIPKYVSFESVYGSTSPMRRFVLLPAGRWAITGTINNTTTGIPITIRNKSDNAVLATLTLDANKNFTTEITLTNISNRIYVICNGNGGVVSSTFNFTRIE
jgi:hypothetical protein